jgi:hypothetical protein
MSGKGFDAFRGRICGVGMLYVVDSETLEILPVTVEEYVRRPAQPMVCATAVEAQSLAGSLRRLRQRN